jgi:transcriptional regulator with XRE-family HTH domain
MTDTNRLRVVRAERRMSQLTLAAVTRIHPTRAWRIENGYVVPTPRERQVIASALGTAEGDIWPPTREGNLS